MNKIYALFMAALLAVVPVFAASASTFFVNKTDDTADGTCDADCSLREAIAAANASSGFDVIWIPAGTYTLSLPADVNDTNAFGDLDITDGVALFGDGADTTRITATLTHDDRIIQINNLPANNNDVVIAGLTIRNGDTDEGGAGILANGADLTLQDCALRYNDSGENGGGLKLTNSSLNMNRCAITENTANNGAGLYVDTPNMSLTANVLNSTLSGNTAYVSGGAIGRNTGNINVVYSSVSYNTVDSNAAGPLGGGLNIASGSGNVQMLASILSDNTLDTSVDNCSGTILSLGFNHVKDTTGCTFTPIATDWTNENNGIDLLANNGGPTSTHAIAYPDRPYNCSHQTVCVDIVGDYVFTDQRGGVRKYDGACDIGAYEYCEDDFLPQSVATRYALREAAPDSNVSNASHVPHSIWLQRFYGDNVTVRMLFDNTAYFDINNDGSATLTGTATVQNGPNQGDVWEVSVSFSATTSNNPKTELRNGFQPSGVTDNWSYFTLDSGTFTQTSGGIGVATITQFSAFPFQIGYAANGKNMNFGGSAWISFSHDPGNNQPLIESSAMNVHGDFNLDLIQQSCPQPGNDPDPDPDPTPECGNGTVEDGEDCDDGNTDNWDGCSSICEDEPDPVCGNGQQEAGEDCDDGNTDNGDGCSSICEIEPPLPICGNQILEDGEDCDDGNTENGDGCSSTCEDEPVCGDGVVEGDEECDDGNTDDDDGCSSTCEDEPVVVTPVCGNSLTETGEECDDGNTESGDGCSSTCETENTTPPEPDTPDTSDDPHTSTSTTSDDASSDPVVDTQASTDGGGGPADPFDGLRVQGSGTYGNCSLNTSLTTNQSMNLAWLAFLTLPLIIIRLRQNQSA